MRTSLKLLFTSVIIGGVCGGVSAQVSLAGEVSGSYQAGEYFISGDVVVLHGTTLSFAPGSVVRFAEYTGITVHGSLVCKGTPQRPIIFTSANDKPHTRTLPEAFDWNGIKVSFEAEGVSLEYCTFAYSTFGLNIESNATPVSMKSVSFIHSGTVSLTRGKKMVPVQETAPISFVWPETAALTADADGQGKLLDESGGHEGKPAEPSLGPVGTGGPYKYRRGRLVRRITFGILAAGSGIAGVLFDHQANSLYNDYKDDRTYDVAKHDADWQAVEDAEKTRNVFYMIAGVCAAAFTISIPF
jgi:hypothetical protein